MSCLEYGGRPAPNSGGPSSNGRTPGYQRACPRRLYGTTIPSNLIRSAESRRNPRFARVPLLLECDLHVQKAEGGTFEVRGYPPPPCREFPNRLGLDCVDPPARGAARLAWGTITGTLGFSHPEKYMRKRGSMVTTPAFGLEVAIRILIIYTLSAGV